MDTARSNKGPILLLFGAVAVVVILTVAWNGGRESAMRDEAFGATCRAATDVPSESTACIERMKRTYRGPIDSYDQTANAAAQHVADYQAGR